MPIPPIRLENLDNLFDLNSSQLNQIVNKDNHKYLYRMKGISGEIEYVALEKGTVSWWKTRAKVSFREIVTDLVKDLEQRKFTGDKAERVKLEGYKQIISVMKINKGRHIHYKCGILNKIREVLSGWANKFFHGWNKAEDSGAIATHLISKLNKLGVNGYVPEPQVVDEIIVQPVAVPSKSDTDVQPQPIVEKVIAQPVAIPSKSDTDVQPQPKVEEQQHTEPTQDKPKKTAEESEPIKEKAVKNQLNITEIFYSDHLFRDSKALKEKLKYYVDISKTYFHTIMENAIAFALTGDYRQDVSKIRKIYDALVELGLNEAAQNKDGDTLLHFICMLIDKFSQLEEFKYLIKHETLYIPNKEGATPLYLIYTQFKDECTPKAIENLRKENDEIDTLGTQDRKAVLLLKTAKEARVVAHVTELERINNINHVDSDGFNIYHDIIIYLLEKDTLDATEKALWEKLLEQHMSDTKELINGQNSKGQTPLHLVLKSTSENKLWLLNLLKNLGADERILEWEL